MLFEEKLIFFPERYPAGQWNPVMPPGFSLKDVSFASGSLNLHGWFIEPEKILRNFALLICHGNAGNITSRLPRALAAASCGVPVFLFDYRGYGKSDPAGINEQAIYEDAEAAFKWLLQKGFSQDRLIVHGISLGGGAACYLAENFQFPALSLESTFTSIPDMCRLVYPWIPKFMVGTKFNNLERIKKLKLPIQVLHGTDDELIPMEMGQQLYDAAAEPKWLIPVSGAGHGDLLEKAGDLYRNSFENLFNHLSQQSC